MKQVQLSGIIRFEENNSFPQIKLIQEGGYKIDLVSRFIEIDESFPKSKIQVNYWLSEKPCTKNEMLENTLRRLFGDINAEYEKSEYNYSSLTGGWDYDTTLQIGGHNLFDELREEEGRFMIIEVNIQ